MRHLRESFFCLFFGLVTEISVVDLMGVSGECD